MTKTEEEWEDVVVAPGNWVSWDTPGQMVTGWVVTYDATKGTTDYNGDECGLLVIDDAETRELRSITLSLAALKTTVAAASPHPGLMLRITYTGDVKSAGDRTYKNFTIQKGASKAPERPAEDPLEEPFVVDAGEWQPYAWGQYPNRMLG